MMSRAARWISSQSVATPSSTTVTRYCRCSATVTVACTQMSVIVPVTTSEVTSRTSRGGGVSIASVRHLARRRRRAGQARKDVAGDQLDLLGFVAVGDEDEPIHPRLDVGAKLRDTLVRVPANRVLDRRFAPGRHVPLGLEPSPHRRLGRLARGPDVDRELIRARERVRIAAGLAREADDLLPRAAIALRRVEVREPSVAARGHALEYRVDVAADQDRRPRLLEGARPHHGLAQVVLVD